MSTEVEPAPIPRVLVDLASLEHVDVGSFGRVRGPLSFRSTVPPRFARATNGTEAPHRSECDRPALVTIGRLAREGRITLCTYDEFDAPGPQEQWGGTWRELLGDVPVERIAPAVDRAELGEDVFRGGEQSGALARLCARLKQTEYASDEGPFAAGSEVAADGATAPQSFERYRQLAARVQGHHLADLFHLWSAERAGCAYWLTLDGALAPFLREWVEPSLGTPLSCAVVLPNGLLDRLGIEERDPVGGPENRVVSLRATPP